MNKTVNVLGGIILGAIGFWHGMAGNPMGWIFVVAAAWSIVATIRRKADAKDGQAGKDGSNSWFDIGGCGGCGGGCGCD
jgi:hypothetical protein